MLGYVIFDIVPLYGLVNVRQQQEQTAPRKLTASNVQGGNSI
jgi:hypothetical protein